MKKNGPVLACKNLVFSYPGSGKTVLENLSFEQERGGIICVLGPSGCGKTTLLNLAAGFLHPDGGALLFNGIEVRKPERSRIMVFQGYTQLFPWLNAGDNVLFPMRTKSRTRALSLLALTGLADAGHFYPSQLSGGMKQRVALARALAADPEMLLLDEPFEGLDAPSRRDLQRTLVSVRDSTATSILMVTHNIDEAVRTADRVLLLGANGRQVGDIPVDLPTDEPFREETVRELKKDIYRLLSAPTTR